ncbi:beta-glucosidase [Pseudolysinimonas sp.]|uniref:beta-xylosidase/alpha-l-arabinosidase n=1 Tax=Pseudolysinimonas sp. TaxID=2680009 RepID=UPI003784A508
MDVRTVKTNEGAAAHMSETSQPRRADADDRVESLIRTLPLEAKLAQLAGLWAGAKRTDDAAPLQERLVSDGIHFEEFAAAGLGQLTRHYGTTPLDPEAARDLLVERQRWLADNAPGGIVALVHEECLTGVLAWKAIAYPTPLAWGATFDPSLVERMAARIGADLRVLGVHQGLAPVLDVVRDLRWGRVEECLAEDPLVVGELGSAYVRGLESQGRVATLKHFAGYSASRAGRNHGSVAMGRRELEDVVLPPFERAIRGGGARSVMNAYTDLDGVPAAADTSLLTGVLRERWGFTGTVVADYFAIAFLESMHGVADDLGAAAALALEAGIDVELPTGSAYREPLRALVESGAIPEALVDRALRRVLRQKAELGLLDGGGMPDEGPIELDGADHRALAREVAEASIVLLENDGILPLAAPARIAVLGPNAADVPALFGCYSFVNHVLTRHPDVPLGLDVATVLDAVRAEYPHATVTHADGCAPTGDDRAGFADAVRLAAAADVAVVVLGDRAGMFGAGTSGEGCDAVDLKLPGVQHEFAQAVIASGTPTVLVLVTGRPYELRDLADGAAGIVQAFFPATEGAAAIAGVLSGRVNPSGRLPVGLPGDHAPQPSGYRHVRLDGPTGVSSADPTPRYPFGFGLSYTTFELGAPLLDASEVATDGAVVLRVEARNTGTRDGVELVQVYAHDPVASVTRPLRELVAFARIALAVGETAMLEFRLPSRSFSFTDAALQRVVEPGRIDLTVARDAGDPGQTVAVVLTGPRRVVPVSEFDPATWTRA